MFNEQFSYPARTGLGTQPLICTLNSSRDSELFASGGTFSYSFGHREDVTSMPYFSVNCMLRLHLL